MKKVITNEKKKQHFVQRKTATINTYIAVPFSGTHGATRLTIRSGETRMDLNGRQVRALREVLAESTRLNQRTVRSQAKPVTPATKPVTKPATKPSRKAK